LIRTKYRRIPVGALTGTATNGFIFGGSRVLYDETKEGGCTTTVHADKPGEIHKINKTDDNELLFNRTMNDRISAHELSKVTNQTT
jgi:hypothetical protein